MTGTGTRAATSGRSCLRRRSSRLVEGAGSAGGVGAAGREGGCVRLGLGCGVIIFLTEAATEVSVVWEVDRCRGLTGTSAETAVSSFGGDERERNIVSKMLLLRAPFSLDPLIDCAVTRPDGGGSCEPLETERAIDDGVFRSSCSDGDG